MSIVFPTEIINKITKHLVPYGTSRNLWRIADPFVAKLLSKNVYSRPWSRRDMCTCKNMVNAIISNLAAQAGYDNHMVAFIKYWNILLTDKYDFGRDLCIKAAIMNSSKDVWKFLITNCKVFDIEYNVEKIRLSRIAAAESQFSFLRNVLGQNKEQTIKILYEYDKRFYKNRFDRVQKHPVIEMAKRRNFDGVDWFMRGVEKYYTDFYDQTIKNVLNACAAYGYIHLLVKYSDKCDFDMLTYAISVGTSVEGLEWLYKYKAQLFNGKFKCKERKLVKMAIRRGSPAILNWLNDKKIIDIEAMHGKQIVEMAKKKGYSRVLNWINRMFVYENEKPYWWNML